MLPLAEAFAAAARYHQGGQLPAAEQACHQILATDPNHINALHLLGVISAQLGKHDVAIEVLNQAIRLQPNNASLHSNLGGALRARGDLDSAVASFHRALELKPNDALANYNLGTVLHEQGNFDEAVSCFQRALAAKPNFIEAHNNLGKTLHARQQDSDAIACFWRALELNPQSAQSHYNLGVVFQDQRNFDEAATCFSRALELNPDYDDAQLNLGVTFRNRGNIEEAIRCYRRAVELRPDIPEFHSNLVYALYFCPGLDTEAIATEHRVWNDRHAAPLRSSIQPHDNDPSPDRRLRIGYVASDFKGHCQTLFTIPLFSHHDHNQFEITCYSNVDRTDEYTHKLRSLVDHWRDIVGQSPAQIAQLVRQDQIDILVDLTMHMENGVPLLFARKPAPVQICWLAYPGTTGQTAIDYRFTDPHLDPPELFDRLYSEESIRLPHSFWCYDPLTTQPPVNRLPVLDNNYITFGCLNNFCKINDGTLHLWAAVMKAVDDSRLILLAPDGSARDQTLATLNQEGIVSDRITFAPFQKRSDYLATYHRIDVCLETLPYNGHTTSLDAFWMGVPVPTLIGQTIVGRAGVSLLENLGLPELIAHTPQQYVDVIRQLTANLPALADLRATLRQTMEKSPLMNGAIFARDMEAAYRLIWKRWCATRQ